MFFIYGLHRAYLKIDAISLFHKSISRLLIIITASLGRI